MESEQDMLRETYRLAKENNKMLHVMRRNAFLGGLLKLLVYGAIVFIPLWLYMQYLAPTVNQMMQTVQNIQGTSIGAQTQMSDWQKTFEDLKSKIPGLSSTSQN